MKTLTHNIYNFRCNRSGSAKLIPLGKRKRHIKTQGSCKINATCAAYITAFVSHKDSTVRVVFCTQHTGHEVEERHLPIPLDIRELVVKLLLEGIEEKIVL